MSQKNRILTEYTAIAALLVGILFSNFDKFQRLIVSLAAVLPPWAIHFLLASLTFALLFRGCILFYYLTVWRLINAGSYLGGKWTYSYKDNQDSAQQKQGEATFYHSVESISASGKSGSAGTGFVAKWHSKAAAIENNHVILAVQLHGDAGLTEGYVLLDIDEKAKKWLGLVPSRPEQLIGFFYLYDKSAATPYASITFTRK